MVANGRDVKTYPLDDYTKCEFLGYARNSTAIAVKTSNSTVDLIDAESMTLIKKLDADQAKCLLTTADYTFIGTWMSNVMVFSAEGDFVKVIKTKTSIRSLCLTKAGDSLVIGQNDGWIDIVKIATLENVETKKLAQLGHIFQIQP